MQLFLRTITHQREHFYKIFQLYINLEEMFSHHLNVYNYFKFSTTQQCVTRREMLVMVVDPSFHDSIHCVTVVEIIFSYSDLWENTSSYRWNYINVDLNGSYFSNFLHNQRLCSGFLSWNSSRIVLSDNNNNKYVYSPISNAVQLLQITRVYAIILPSKHY